MSITPLSVRLKTILNVLLPVNLSHMRAKCGLASAALIIAASSGANEPTLYARLGGEPVVRRVVEEAVAKLIADPRVNQSFAGVNLKRLDSQIELQICSLTAGGCTYDGDDMKTAHAGLNITEEEFYALVDAFREAMDDNGVGQREKNELLRLLAPMKRDIVTH